MPVTIRLAEPADVPAVAAVIDAAYAHYIPIIGRRPRPMDDDHAARISRAQTYLLEDDNGPAGVISIAPRDGAMHVFNLALDPKAQGQGHSKRLLDGAEARARSLGFDRLTLYTHALMTRNRAIYAHLGFTEIRIDDGGGYDIVFMERPVAA